MKSRSNELVDKSVAAMLAAIEIYNKPDFPYRGETFAILAINSWELLLKAKILKNNSNKINSLFVKEPVKNKDGTNSKKKKIKVTKSGNPFTISIDFAAKKLLDRKDLDPVAYNNLLALIELRDSSVHFYNYSLKFNTRIQEIGTATLKNYVVVIGKWFNKDLSKFNFYLMPLSFVQPDKELQTIMLNGEEKNFFKYVEQLEDDSESSGEYSVALNINVKFTRSTSKDDIKVALTQDSDAINVILTEEQIRQKYPFDYRQLTEKCKVRYSNFKENNEYHKIRQIYESDNSCTHIRYLDPNNSKGNKKKFYSEKILSKLDSHYKKR